MSLLLPLTVSHALKSSGKAHGAELPLAVSI